MRRAALTALVLSLLAGTAAAFAVTQSLKLERAPVGKARFAEPFSPTCGCARQVARLSFRLRRSDRLDLDIVSDGESVRTLARGVERPRGRVFVRWDGRDDAGAVVPDGRYRLQVRAAGAGRTIVMPKGIDVDTQPPELELGEAAGTAVTPNGAGPSGNVELALTVSEKARLLVLVDGRLARVTKPWPAGEHTFVWSGRVRGSPLEPGTVDLSVRARDEAGNLSPVEAGPTIQVRAGGTGG